jgi:hypothetical protein
MTLSHPRGEKGLIRAEAVAARHTSGEAVAVATGSAIKHGTRRSVTIRDGNEFMEYHINSTGFR